MWKGRLGAVVLAAALAGSLAAPAAADPGQSNYELVSVAARKACASLVTKLQPQLGGQTVALRGVGTAAGNFLVENAFSSALAEAGLQVRTRPDSVLPIVEFEVADLAVSYLGSHRTRWIGPRWVEREARARLFARVLDPSGAQVKWADQAEGRVADRVRAGDLKSLEEEKPVAYAKPTPPAAHWNKVLEPVVVTGIVVGLIFLFFSNQETN